MLEFCTTNDLVIGGNLFPHHNIHKLTWCSTNGRDRNQIDHLMINGMWRQPLLDVRVKRGADVGSDHHLVIVALTLRRIRQKKEQDANCLGANPIIYYNVENRGDPRVKNAFILKLKNRFQALADNANFKLPDPDEVNTKWEKVKPAYFETSKAYLGTKLKKRRE